MRGVPTKDFEPNKTQAKAIERLAKTYSAMVKARNAVDPAREAAATAAQKARDLGVPREVLVKRVGSTGAVVNLLQHAKKAEHRRRVRARNLERAAEQK